MNKVIKRKWLAALRSGKYVQGRESLQQTSLDGKVTYCCLGVLCEVMGVDAKKQQQLNAAQPQPEVLAVAGVPEVIGELDPLDHLINMNDGVEMAPKSFKQIANWIEKHL